MPDLDISKCLFNFLEWITNEEDSEIKLTFTLRKENKTVKAYYDNAEQVAALIPLLADDPLLFKIAQRAIAKRLSELDDATRKSMLAHIYELALDAPMTKAY